MDIHRLIEAERNYQDSKWGGPEHDDEVLKDNWRGYILEYISGTGRAACYDYPTRLVKTAALATAALESHYRINSFGINQRQIIDSALNIALCCALGEPEIVAEVQRLVEVSESNYSWAMTKIIATTALAHASLMVSVS